MTLTTRKKTILRQAIWQQRADDLLREPLTVEQWRELPVTGFLVLVTGTLKPEEYNRILEIAGNRPVYWEIPSNFFQHFDSDAQWEINLARLEPLYRDIAALQQKRTGIFLNAENEGALIQDGPDFRFQKLDPEICWPQGDAPKRMRQYVEHLRGFLPKVLLGADLWFVMEERLPSFVPAMRELYSTPGEKLAFCMDYPERVAKLLKPNGEVPTYEFLMLRSPKGWNNKPAMLEQWMRNRGPRMYLFCNLVYFAQFPEAYPIIRDCLKRARNL